MLKMSASIIGANTLDDQINYIQAIKSRNIDFEITPTKSLELLNDCKVVSIQSILKYNKQIFESIENCNEVLDLLEESMNIVNKFNINNIVFGLPKNRLVNNKDELNNSKYFFNEFTKRYNHNISIEPNCEAYKTNFLTNLNDTANYVRDLNNSLIRINFDLGSFIYNNGDLNTIKNNIDLINHVHISAPYLSTISTFIPEFTEVVRLLNKCKYNNYISLEEVSPESFYDDLDLFYNIVRGNSYV